MPSVIGVRFRTSTRMYYFAPTEGEEYPKGTKIIVETQRGVEVATVILPVTEVDESKIVAPLKGVLRKATESDLEAMQADDEKKQEILAIAKQKAAARGLDMKIVDCEFTVDHSKLVVYFTAEQRVDFRELVRDLASAFHMRIDLRQIGAREECKLIGTLGACGMPCCCGRFESDAEHVSIKMAKCQNLALTPNKINGMCGRLLCCLGYENKTYEEVAKRSPKVGSWVTCPDGRRGTVVSITPLTEKVRIRVGDEENFEFAEYALSDIGFERKDGESQDNGGSSSNQNNKSVAPQPKQRQDKQKGNPQSNQNKQNGRNGENRNNRTNQNNQNRPPRDGQNGGNGGQNGKGGKKNKKRFNKNKKPEGGNAPNDKSSQPLTE